MGNAILVAIALAVIFMVIVQYRKRAVLDRSWQWIPKEKSPFIFWAILIIQTMMAGVVAALGMGALQL